MTLSLIVFLLILYRSLVKSNSKNSRKQFIIITTIVMILISGLRHEGVGNDTLATMMGFEQTIDKSWQEVFTDFWGKYFNPNVYVGKDPGEPVFYKTLSLFTTDTRVFLFVVAIIVLLSLGCFIYYSTQSLQTTLFSYIYFITLSYNYIPNSSFRQAIAFAILLLGYIALNSKKYLYFILLLFLASLFHKSVLIAFILCPMMLIKKVKELYWFSLLPFFIVFIYYQPVGALFGGFSDIYDAYASINYYSHRSLPIMVILMVLGLYLYSGFALQLDRIEEKNRIYIYGTVLTLIFVPLVRFDPSALRLISYFAVLMAIQVGDTSNRSSSMRALYWVIILIFLIKAAITPDDGYRFMWQKKQLHERYGMIISPKQITPKNSAHKSYNIYPQQSKMVII